MLGGRWRVGAVALVLVSLSACEPENLAEPLPLLVERSGDEGIILTVPLCEGDRVLSTWVRSADGDYRSARWRDSPSPQLDQRLVTLAYTSETLTDASFSVAETAPEVDDFRGEIGGPAKMRDLGVRTSRGTEGGVLQGLPDTGPGRWLIHDDVVEAVDSTFEAETLFEGWCDS